MATATAEKTVKNKPAVQAVQADEAEGYADEPILQTGKEVLLFLKASGTPIDRTRPLEDWLKTNQAATAKDFYAQMQATLSPYIGTLRKAGKRVFGFEFEPEEAHKSAPADELLDLKRQNDRLQHQISSLNAEKLGLSNRVVYLENRCDELIKENSYLKMGRGTPTPATV